MIILIVKLQSKETFFQGELDDLDQIEIGPTRPAKCLKMELDHNDNDVISATASRTSSVFEVPGPPNKSLPERPLDRLALIETGRPGQGHDLSWKCETCGLGFNQDYQLWFHWRDHIPRLQRHQCTLCPFVSQNLALIKSHRCAFNPLPINTAAHGVHAGGGSATEVACNVCRGAFIAKDRADLSRHVFRSHMYDKRFHLPMSSSSLNNNNLYHSHHGFAHPEHPGGGHPHQKTFQSPWCLSLC